MKFSWSAVAGLVTAGLVATSTVATATPAVAADGRADILSIAVSNPTPGDMDCQDLQISTTWNVAQGYDVFSARMHFTNNDGTLDSGFDTADVSPQLYAYGQSTRLSTWLYCPGLDGTGSFTAGNTEIVIYDETTGDQVAVTSPVTTTFGAPIVAPPVPTPVPTPPPTAPAVVATASRLVVTRPDGGAKLDFDVYTKAVGQILTSPWFRSSSTLAAAGSQSAQWEPLGATRTSPARIATAMPTGC